MHAGGTNSRDPCPEYGPNFGPMVSKLYSFVSIRMPQLRSELSCEKEAEESSGLVRPSIVRSRCSQPWWAHLPAKQVYYLQPLVTIRLTVSPVALGSNP